MKFRKQLLLTLFLFTFLSITKGYAQVNTNTVWVNGYTKSNGTYVQGHYRTAPNNTINDNYTTYPNVNPYTGVQGTIDPEPISSPSSLFNSSNIFESTPINIEPSTWTPTSFDVTIPVYTPITTPSTNIWGGGGSMR